MMLKTISSRFILIFIMVLILAFSLTGAALYYLLGDYLIDEKVRLLEDSGDELNEFINAYIESQETPLARLYLSRMFDFYSISTGSLIFLVNDRGAIVNAGPDIEKMPVEVTSMLKQVTGNLVLPEQSQYKNILAGSRIKEVGDFYGLYQKTGHAWITVGLPFRYSKDDSGTDIVGGLLLSTPLPGIEATRTRVLSLYLISIALTITISIIIAYMFSQRITKPIKKIRNAAKSIASGNFEKRLDISSRDEVGDLARTFNNMATALENLEEMRRGFIANVSHELRTPMTSITGFIEGILDGTVPADKHTYYLRIVKDEAERLNRLVNDLLDLARMESGELKLNFTDFDMNELIRRSVIKLERQLTSKGIEVHADFEEDGLYVKADIDAIERVVLNLLHNAVKFSPQNGKLAITATTSKNKAVISIKDNGIGINSEEIDLIWERFYKSDKSRARDKGGAGLGLAIVKSLIGEHGEEIWAENGEEGGSTFSFTLALSEQA